MTTEITTSPGAPESSKESLIGDLKGIAGKADQLLKEAGQTVVEDFLATRNVITEKACGAAHVTRDYVRENPWKVVGLAAAVGVFMGILIRRH